MLVRSISSSISGVTDTGADSNPRHDDLGENKLDMPFLAGLPPARG
jgi:hypothetical protein